MTRVRLSIGNDRKLRDRHGTVYGEIVTLTVDIDPAAFGGAMGQTGVDGERPELSLELGVDAGVQTTAVAGARDATRATRSITSESIAAVWTCYVEVMKPRRKEAGDDERKIIRDALKVATVEECCGAIRGCHASDWHMGRDPQTRGKSYKTLSHILKGKRPNERNPQGRTTRETVDFFLEIAAKKGVQSPVTSVDPARLRRAKQDVRDAQEFPGDVHAVERGNRARRWLEDQGYSVQQEGERITFVPPTTASP